MLAYAMQVQLCWILFYGIYYLFLRRETFFTINRIYLLSALVLGLLIPLNIPGIDTGSPVTIWLDMVVVSAGQITQEPASGTAETFRWGTLLNIIYFSGVFISGLAFLTALLRMRRITLKSTLYPHSDWHILDTGGLQLPPFSFLNLIFMDINRYSESEMEQIILHESVHIRQFHTIDNIFLEILKIIFWWSPVVYFYKKALSNQHEFLADEGVIQVLNSKSQYGRFLIGQAKDQSYVRLANHLIFSQIRMRIVMMTKNRSQRISLLKYTIALPLMLVLSILFAAPDNDVMRQVSDMSDDFLKEPDLREIPLSDYIKPMTTENNTAELTQNNTIPDTLNEVVRSEKTENKNVLDLNDIDIMPVYATGMDSLYRYLGLHLNYPESARQAGIEATIILQFVINQFGKINDIQVLNKTTFSGASTPSPDMVKQDSIPGNQEYIAMTALENEAIRVIREMPGLWRSGKSKGKNVNVLYTLPLRFKLS